MPKWFAGYDAFSNYDDKGVLGFPLLLAGDGLLQHFFIVCSESEHQHGKGTMIKELLRAGVMDVILLS